MAKLILKLPPLPDPQDLQDHTRDLSDEARLIQSMKGFACGVSMVIPAYHFWLGAETAHPASEAGDSYPRLVLTYFMKEAMLDAVLLSLRRLFESDPRSLAVGTIANLLAREDMRAVLRIRSRVLLKEAALPDHDIDGKIEVLLIQCAIHLSPSARDPLLARVGRQVQLARRAANKRAAHITLDEYAISLDDIHQLVSNALAIARSIQGLLGRDACDTDLVEVDGAAYEAAAHVFGISHACGRLVKGP